MAKITITSQSENQTQSKVKLKTTLTKQEITTSINVISMSGPTVPVHQLIKSLYRCIYIDFSFIQSNRTRYLAQSIIEEQNKKYEQNMKAKELLQKEKEIQMMIKQMEVQKQKQKQKQRERQLSKFTSTSMSTTLFKPDIHAKQFQQRKIQAQKMLLQARGKKKIKQQKRTQKQLQLQKQKQKQLQQSTKQLTYQQQKIAYQKAKAQLQNQKQRELIAMKVKAFKQSHKFYYLIRNQDVFLELDQEQKADVDIGTDVKIGVYDQKNSEIKIATSNNNKVTTSQKVKNGQNKNLSLHKITEKNQNKQKNIQVKIDYLNTQNDEHQKNLHKQQKQSNKLQKYLKDQYNFGDQSRQKLQDRQFNFDQYNNTEDNQNNESSARNVRETFQLCKKLCLFKECVVKIQDLKGVQNMDDPEWVQRNFNFPQHSKYDRYTMEGNRQGYLEKIFMSIDVTKSYLEHGYGLKTYRKNCQEKTQKPISKEDYSRSIAYGVRTGFRQLQNFLIMDCQKPIQPLTYSQLYLLAIPLYRARQQMTSMQQNIWFKLLSAVFRLNVVSSLTKNELFTIYNTIRKKLAERRDAIQYKLARTIQNEVQMIIKYYSYSQNGQVQFFGHDNGVQSIQDIYDPYGRMEQNVTGVKCTKKKWSEQFQLQFIKLYLQYRKISQVRVHLLQRFTDQWYKQQFQLKKGLNSRFQRVFRRSIQFIQYDFRKYSMALKIAKINFYQKKFLTLTQAEARVITFNEEAVQTRLMILDYYVNNLYGKSRNSMNDHNIKYRITYINYLIESMAQVLESKKNLLDVMDDDQSQRVKMFELKQIRFKKWQLQSRNISHCEQQSDKVLKTVRHQLDRIRAAHQTKAKIKFEQSKHVKKRMMKSLKIQQQQEDDNQNQNNNAESDKDSYEIQQMNAENEMEN